MSDLGRLHDAVTVLREAIVAQLGEMLPPYAYDVLYDLQELTAQSEPDLTKLRALVGEADGVMDMLPNIPAEWESVNRAAAVASLSPTK